MRRTVVVALLAMALPRVAWADSSTIVFRNTGRRVTIGGTNALTVNKSPLQTFTGVNGVTVGGHGVVLGTVNFTTGVLHTVRFTFDAPNAAQSSTGVRLNSSATTVPVPEPGTLGLLGTGLIGIASLIRRKVKVKA